MPEEAPAPPLPPAPWLVPAAGDPAVRALDAAQDGRLVLEDFRPLAESLEWELGQEYYSHRGSLAFVGDPEPVPFAVNNDGNQSIRAAEVFFTSLSVAETEGPLPADLFVLELGIGVGLFARYFLDWFRHLCERENKDYYGRLCYVAADRSPRMLDDARRRGVFQNHPGRYRLRLADALCPESALLADHDVARLGPRPFRAVFLNYLLDCLPAAVVRCRGAEMEVLHARTSLPPGADWSGDVAAGPDDLRWLAASARPGDRQRLLPLYPLLQAEYQYRPAGQLPDADFILQHVREAQGRPVLHNYGAVRCLQALLGLLAAGGVILVNDYGTAKEIASDDFEHQRYSHSTAVGVNFALLKQFFGVELGACWQEPVGQDSPLHSRLLTHRASPQIAARFAECYGEPTRGWLEQPAVRARGLAQAGRFQAALSQYREALARQPFNWVLMGEVAQFLAFATGSPKGGLEVVWAALRHNPACSADLWGVTGDCLFLLGRTAEARGAYEKALAVNGDDVRARYGMAFVHASGRDYRRALACLAEALALDVKGAYRDRLLQKQGEILALLAQHRQRRSLGEANRVAGLLPATTQWESAGSTPSQTDPDRAEGPLTATQANAPLRGGETDVR